MIMVTVDKTKCDGDGTCVNVCPQAVFKLENGKAEPVNMSECINCLTCWIYCPDSSVITKDGKFVEFDYDEFLGEMEVADTSTNVNVTDPQMPEENTQEELA